ncbi:MAG: beta-ketoacyl-ACP synthase III [Gammaproteobacteria bacterium]|nr:beta-ketoacyl-ACP synthase III [Gammaproteobacteria bacterium]
MPRPVYITRTASFLPHAPLDNEAMEPALGLVGGKPSRARRIVLRSNGIKSRHYVLDPATGEPSYSNAQLTAEAVRGLTDEGFDLDGIQVLATGTTIPDQLAPNHAVMVHGELGLPVCEAVSTAGICLSGTAALKYAYLAVKAGEADAAVATGSEVSSLLLRAQNFEAETEHKLNELAERPEIAFEKDFLRWMLSDGAGAVLLQDRPRSEGPSLRIDWLELFSYAHELPACMYAGAHKDAKGHLKGWLRHKPETLRHDSVLAIKQDVKLLNENVVTYTLSKPLQALMAKRGLRAAELDWFLPHMSSEYFREPIGQCLDEIGLPIPAERWFTNLTEKGNTGSASPYIMLDELFRSGRLKAGERLLMFVPESGRFSSGFIHLTVV